VGNSGFWYVHVQNLPVLQPRGGTKMTFPRNTPENASRNRLLAALPGRISTT
jgi:hypothetical protein